MPPFQTTPDPPDDGLALTVGCTFELESTFAVAAIMQVAPGPDPRVQMRHELWDTGSDHHSYVDLYGNRCERLTIAAGRLGHDAWQRFGTPAPGLGARAGGRRLRPWPPRVGLRRVESIGRRRPTRTAPGKGSAATSPASRSRSAAR